MVVVAEPARSRLSYTFPVTTSPPPTTGIAPRRIGILGGTFDPPHRGHLAAARAVRDALDLDLVVMMVAGEPWQKVARRTVSAPEVRLAMVEALVDGEDSIVAGDAEIVRGGPTYTVDTLRGLVDSEPTATYFLILGADAARNLPTWREVDEVVALSTLVIVNRPGQDRTSPLEGARVEYVEMVPVEVSSSAIRETVSHGGSPEPATTAAVARLIARHDLYVAS